jgi:Mg2+ and Co2+ transporter CorA
MTILTRQERERFVLDLYYNQGNTYREICKQLRISPHDIGIIVNKRVKEKIEGINKKIILILRRTKIKKNNNSYLFPLKPTRARWYRRQVASSYFSK